MTLARANLWIMAVVFLAGASLWAGIPLETETARTQDKGGLEANMGFEYQTSSTGKEQAAPMALEYGLYQNLEILVEPVFYTAILPDQGRNAIGLGDLEVTLNYRFLSEKNLMPALALAGELKIPTARDTLIGTKKADYAGYIIFSKAMGPCDVHGNLGYTFVGEPPGTHLSNLYSFALAVEQIRAGPWQLMAETYGNTSSFGGGNSARENPITPEAASGELVGAVGVRYFFHPRAAVVLGISYDNSNALLVAPGLIFHIR